MNRLGIYCTSFSTSAFSSLCWAFSSSFILRFVAIMTALQLCISRDWISPVMSDRRGAVEGLRINCCENIVADTVVGVLYCRVLVLDDFGVP